MEGGATVNKRFNRFWTSFGFGARHDDYDDTSIDGMNVDQDFRDGERFVVVSRVGYDVSPLTAIFAETAHNWRTYDEDLFESDGIRVVGGVKFEPTRVVKGQVYAGWLEQSYDSDELEDISTWTLGGLLAWHPSPLLTVTSSATARPRNRASTAARV
jgi:hypothetical protein